MSAKKKKFENFDPIESKFYQPGSLNKLAPLPCRSPSDKGVLIALQVKQEYIDQLAGHSRNSKLFEVWANLYGEIPPINCIGHHEGGNKPPLVSLAKAHRLYRGLQRGCNSKDNGEDVLIYITEPRYTYEWANSQVCVAKCVELEDKTVMATYVRMFSGKTSEDRGVPKGEVIGWDFITGVLDDKILVPEDSGNRYKEVVW